MCTRKLDGHVRKHGVDFMWAGWCITGSHRGYMGVVPKTLTELWARSAAPPARAAAEEAPAPAPAPASSAGFSARFALGLLASAGGGASLASSFFRSLVERATREPPSSVAETADWVERVRLVSPAGEASCFFFDLEEEEAGEVIGSSAALLTSWFAWRRLRCTLLGSAAAGSAARFLLLRPRASLPPSSIAALELQVQKTGTCCGRMVRTRFVDDAQSGRTPARAERGEGRMD